MYGAMPNNDGPNPLQNAATPSSRNIIAATWTNNAVNYKNTLPETEYQAFTTIIKYTSMSVPSS
jgi:hypothetical protein